MSAPHKLIPFNVPENKFSGIPAQVWIEEAAEYQTGEEMIIMAQHEEIKKLREALKECKNLIARAIDAGAYADCVAPNCGEKFLERLAALEA